MASPVDPTQAIALAIDAFSTPPNAEKPQPTPLEERAEENEETPLDRAATMQNDTVEISPRAAQQSLIGSSGNLIPPTGDGGNTEIAVAASLSEKYGAGAPRPGSYFEVLA